MAGGVGSVGHRHGNHKRARTKVAFHYENSTHEFLFEVICVDEGVLGGEEDGGDELGVGEGGDLVVVLEGVLPRHHRVDPAGVHPLRLRAPPAPGG